MKDEIKNYLHNQFGSSGIVGIVQLIKANYAIQSIPVSVSSSGHEIKIDLQHPEVVKEYLALRYIIDREDDFPETQLDNAKRAVNKMKWDILDRKQSAQDRNTFIDADVRYITYSIGGVFLVHYPIE